MTFTCDDRTAGKSDSNFFILATSHYGKGLLESDYPVKEFINNICISVFCPFTEKYDRRELE